MSDFYNILCCLVKLILLRCLENQTENHEKYRTSLVSLLPPLNNRIPLTLYIFLSLIYHVNEASLLSDKLSNMMNIHFNVTVFPPILCNIIDEVLCSSTQVQGGTETI
jgi:hypothetical protein